jgi:Leucine-rich repeat (LRR) protein
LAIFESAPTTRGLYLFGNQITDDGLRHLSNLPELDFLDLRRNNITDAGLVHLEKLPKLKQVILIGTQVTPAGVNKLQKKLPHTKIAH